VASYLFDFLKQMLESFLNVKTHQGKKIYMTNSWRDAPPSHQQTLSHCKQYDSYNPDKCAW